MAVALTHPEHPPIVNATDSDWTEIEDILRDDYQVQVIQLCPKSTEEPAIKQSRGRKPRPIFDESSPIIEQKPRKRRPTLE
ncbi:hypothetical protein [Herpetosiphon geysericola]|uniref:hypothetical protein n=1 Tax=Herpetosiphon geysericola TaxID=70996 RepID=UPI00128FBF93|nr:hypothetical protein [Herpetosiphon geysericola]